MKGKFKWGMAFIITAVSYVICFSNCLYIYAILYKSSLHNVFTPKLKRWLPLTNYFNSIARIIRIWLIKRWNWFDNHFKLFRFSFHVHYLCNQNPTKNNFILKFSQCDQYQQFEYLNLSKVLCSNKSINSQQYT